MAKKPQVGDPAPDFELEGTNGSFKLSDHRGERVVLLFYPGDNTAVCTKQFCSYRDNAEAFGALDATVIGISGQSLASHRDFSEKHGLTVPLLADEGGDVAMSYGARAPVVGGGDHRGRGRDRAPPSRPPLRSRLPDGRGPPHGARLASGSRRLSRTRPRHTGRAASGMS